MNLFFDDKKNKPFNFNMLKTKVFYYLLLAPLFYPLVSCSIASKGGISNSGEISPNSSPEEPIIRVLVAGRRRHVVKLPMETYLAGVIGNEMSRRWPIEALKAQSVAARSYALYRMEEAKKEGRSFDVVSTQGDQVFRKRDTQDSYLTSIVDKTRGEVLWKNGRVVEAFYSSTCGGKLRSAKEAGLSDDSPIPGLRSDSYCKRSPFRSWMVVTTLEDLADRFQKNGLPVKDLQSVRIKDKDRSGYVKSIEVADLSKSWKLSGDKFRSIMGSMRLKSLLFNVEKSEDEIHLVGRGFGHGVGMCQYGAERMATQGKKYRTILSKYYPGIAIAKIY